MPDKIFENPRLVEIYDVFDGARGDLPAYLAIVKELGARSVIDIGCGTGSFSCLLSGEGFDVTGVDPALQSLEIARRKPNAEKVRWILGDASRLPPMAADLAVMTGNVAQVFLTDKEWEGTLASIHKALRTGAHFVFEVRDPDQKAWLDWTRDKTLRRIDVPHLGMVEGWCDLMGVEGELVSFRWTYRFEAEGLIISSDSTLRFRKKGHLIKSLERSGYVVDEVRDAGDRPQQEFVFICRS